MYSAAYKMLGGKSRDMASLTSSLNVIRQGLPIAMIETATDLLEMKKAEFSPLIGLNIRSMQRKKKTAEQRLSPQQSEHTLMIIELLAQGESYFGDRQICLKWLNQPNVAFGEVAPVDLFDTVAGIEAVSDTLNRLAHGFTA